MVLKRGFRRSVAFRWVRLVIFSFRARGLEFSEFGESAVKLAVEHVLVTDNAGEVVVFGQGQSRGTALGGSFMGAPCLAEREGAGLHGTGSECD